jgi:outer membrane protein assembly factor BamB
MRRQGGLLTASTPTMGTDMIVRPLILMMVTMVGGSCRDTTSPAASMPNERWHAAQVGYAYARPVVVGDMAVFGTGDGQLVAYDAASGAVRWRSKIGVEMIGGANLVERSGVVAAPISGYTSGVDARTGRELWRYVSPLDTVAYRGGPANAGNLVQVHIDADDQTVYIPAWGASVSAVDLQSGAVRWVWRPGPSAGDTAAAGIFRSGAEGTRVSGDTVFVTAWHNLVQNGVRAEAWLVALDRTSGTELWRAVMPSYTGGALIRGSPALYRNLVLFTSAGGYVYAVDRTSREVVWQRTPQPLHTTIAQAEVAGDVVYLDGGDGNVYALGAGDGVERWRSTIGAQLTNDILATDTRLIFASGAYLFILDRATGQQLQRFTQPHTVPDNALFSSAATALGGQIFVNMNGAAWSFDQP